MVGYGAKNAMTKAQGRARRWWAAAGFFLAAAALATPAARGEVYLAATEGYRCSQCHVNRTGGGMRTEFGAVWAQTHLALWVPDREERDGLSEMLRSGQAGPVRFGANLRASHTSVFGSGDREDTNEFDVNQGTLYLEANLFEDRVKLYVDEAFAPGGTRNREAFALLTFPLGRRDEGAKGEDTRGRWWIKAGTFYQPFGYRVLDDETYTRGAAGFNFTNSDDGVEVGFEPGRWQIAVALTNGTQGAPEDNDQKQAALFAEHVRRKWRLGFSASYNSGEILDRSLAAVHGSVTFGKFVLLGEVDYVENELEESAGGGTTEQLAGLLEGRLWITRGQNLRITWDSLDPDRDIGTNTRERFTVGYEGFLLPNLQVRANAVFRQAPPQMAERRDDSLALELHLYF